MTFFFFVRSLLFPTASFNISNLVQFYSKPSTSRLVTFNKLKPNPIYAANDWVYQFNRIVPLWNALPVFDLRLSLPTIKKQLKSFSLIIF